MATIPDRRQRSPQPQRQELLRAFHLWYLQCLAGHLSFLLRQTSRLASVYTVLTPGPPNSGACVSLCVTNQQLLRMWGLTLQVFVSPVKYLMKRRVNKHNSLVSAVCGSACFGQGSESEKVLLLLLQVVVTMMMIALDFCSPALCFTNTGYFL